jgi:hypothetical protein
MLKRSIERAASAYGVRFCSPMTGQDAERLQREITMSKILVVLTSHDELGYTDRTEDDLRALGGHNKKTGD